MDKFRERLSRRRYELGLSLQEVGSRVGVCHSTVRRWESGEIHKVGQERIVALAAALDVSPEYLLGLTDDLKG